MDQHRPRSLQTLSESLQQNLATELQQVENELAALSCADGLAEVRRKEILKRAYLISFARLALGMGEVNGILGWLKSLPVPQSSPLPSRQH